MGKASRTKRQRRERVAPRLFHFTSTFHWPRIMASGELRTTESNVSLYRDNAGPPVVWLTSDPDPSGQHGLDGSMVDKRGVRIEVRAPKAVPWTEWNRTHPMTPAGWRERFIETGGGEATAAAWWVSEDPIPAADFIDVRARD